METCVSASAASEFPRGKRYADACGRRVQAADRESAEWRQTAAKVQQHQETPRALRQTAQRRCGTRWTTPSEKCSSCGTNKTPHRVQLDFGMTKPSYRVMLSRSGSGRVVHVEKAVRSEADAEGADKRSSSCCFRANNLRR